MIWRCVAGASL